MIGVYLLFASKYILALLTLDAALGALLVLLEVVIIEVLGQLELSKVHLC